jgi:hypothetical protein
MSIGQMLYKVLLSIELSPISALCEMMGFLYVSFAVSPVGGIVAETFPAEQTHILGFLGTFIAIVLNRIEKYPGGLDVEDAGAGPTSGMAVPELRMCHGLVRIVEVDVADPTRGYRSFPLKDPICFTTTHRIRKKFRNNEGSVCGKSMLDYLLI